VATATARHADADILRARIVIDRAALSASFTSPAVGIPPG
jgi:hypothetical protein